MDNYRRGIVSWEELFSKNMVQLDHWFYEEGAFHHEEMISEPELLTSPDLWETDEANLKNWKTETKTSIPEKVYFVDGRMRIYARLFLKKYVLLFAEVAAGYVEWSKEGGVKPGFSPQSPPHLRRVIGAPEELFLDLGETEASLAVDDELFFLVKTSSRKSRNTPYQETAQQAVFNAMQELEKQVVNSLLSENAPIIMDGTVHFDTHLFETGKGPCGLVKRIQRLQIPPSENFMDLLFNIDCGERTPFLSAYLSDKSDTVRVFCFTRLVDRNSFYPLKGLVRLEVALQEKHLERKKEELGQFFSSIASLLPSLTRDFPYRRLPENIFPMIALENYLGQYFSTPQWIQSLCHKFIWRVKNA